MGRFIDENGIAEVLMISPGQGSSAYYEAEQLERDVGAFDGGLVFIDHPGKREARDRPERSLRDLVGPIVETPRFLHRGPAGPGSYAKVRVASHWRPFLEELGSDIGASIRAGGIATYKDVAGRKNVKVCERFNPGASFDFVTTAGRGGKMIEMREAALREADAAVAAFNAEAAFVESDGRSDEARFVAWMNGKEGTKEESMELHEVQQQLAEAEGKLQTLQEAYDELQADRDRLAEALALRQARDVIAEAVNDPKVELPQATKTRLIESLSKGAPITDGELDTAALTEAITEAISSETEYLEAIAPKKKGVQGLGRGAGDGGDDGRNTLLESRKAHYMRRGMSETDAARAAEIFVDGR